MKFLISFIGVFLFAYVAIGQTTQPAADQSTPQGALKLFFAADAASNGDALRDLLAADNDAEKSMIAAMADKKTADRNLTDALKVRFPDDWKNDPRDAAQRDLPKIYDRVDQSQVAISGDTATLTSPDGQAAPFTLKRSGEKWRIPLAVLFQSVDQDKLQHDAHQIEIQVKVMRQAAGDVAGGKYATQEEALQAVKQAMFDAAVADHAAATQASH